ncbi:hypothetical protein GH714_043817 [Hevea brasiliensis]|uniref:ABC transporter domain-containing protein n=1 Tax=Hevea brasiliensis TaxID=3981 RepID=A0A6A6K449_HEVBR|nr:hypothetical protein GH714_043817 [Hevea brasiliensis]
MAHSLELQSTGMLSKEQLLLLFDRFSQLTSQPDVKKRIKDGVNDKQEAVAVTTAIQEAIFLEMGIDPSFGISCLGKVNMVYENDQDLMIRFYKFVASEEMACDEAELGPKEFTEKMQSQQKLHEQQLEMLKYMRKFHLDDQSVILGKAGKIFDPTRLWCPSSSQLDVFSRSYREEDDEEALKWAALEKLPTYDRLRKIILITASRGGGNEVDVDTHGFQERKSLLESVGIELPTIEVRFEHLNIETEALVGNSALPTFINFSVNVLEKTAAYISQHDIHIGEMTVRETLAFSARCEGVGCLHEMLAELSRREKAANIKPDPDIDVFMKAAATEGQAASLVTDYILKILGLDICADTLVGDEMLRGISGGQRKRVATAPETYDLFDDIILLSDGQIVYQGPREDVLGFFEHMGFKCPERNGVADFLQEVTSRKDQKQYWAHKDQPYSFITVQEFAEAFQSYDVGQKIGQELSTPFDKSKSHPAALATEKFFKQYFLLLIVNQMASALFRFMAATGRNMIVANTFGSFAVLILFALGGVVLSRDNIRKWWIWGYWLSPMIHGENAIVANEFLGKSWSHIPPYSTESLGVQLLKSRGFFPHAHWYWLGVGALAGFMLVFNLCFTLALTFVNPFEKPQAVIFDEPEPSDRLESSHRTNTGGRLIDNKPGVLTALMGVSGVGKTTLMDVLAGRKTGGYIEGSIKISGYPKKHETFARISGFCEQNDIHSPHVTIYESLLYSAWLRLPPEVDSGTRKARIYIRRQLKVQWKFVYFEYHYSCPWFLWGFLPPWMFVDEVMELVELNPLRQALIGLPCVNGLSTEQRKRLTIAVELVANPSIVFMDKPTSGLDARAAAIVMRIVRNTVDTGRTIVSTIHQPSIDIFEAFDEKIEGVSKITYGYNPATWMLEVTNSAQELSLGVDFAAYYGIQNFTALMLGTMFWDLGSKMSKEQDIFNSAAVLFLGVQNASSVQPVVAVERTVFYRERAAGMYSALPYAYAQVLAELPYVFAQVVVYGLITYTMIGFEWTATKFFWYLFFMYFTLLYYTYYGMMAVAVTPNYHIASIISSAFYGIWNLFSGFVIPRTRMLVVEMILLGMSNVMDLVWINCIPVCRY